MNQLSSSGWKENKNIALPPFKWHKSLNIGSFCSLTVGWMCVFSPAPVTLKSYGGKVKEGGRGDGVTGETGVKLRRRTNEKSTAWEERGRERERLLKREGVRISAGKKKMCPKTRRWSEKQINVKVGERKVAGERDKERQRMWRWHISESLWWRNGGGRKRRGGESSAGENAASACRTEEDV